MEISIEKRREFEAQIELHINEVLYNEGHITQEMYVRAKQAINKELYSP